MNWLSVGEVAARLSVATVAATLFTGDPELIDRDLGCPVRDLRP